MKGIDEVKQFNLSSNYIFCNVQLAKIWNSIAKNGDYRGHDHIHFLRLAWRILRIILWWLLMLRCEYIDHICFTTFVL